MSHQPVTDYSGTTKRGANWDASRPMRQQQQWSGHAVFMNALEDEGFVALGGPLDDGENALLIIAARSEQELADRLADDPWMVLGPRRIAKGERWEILLGARR